MSESLASAFIGAFSGAIIAAAGWAVAWRRSKQSQRQKAVWDRLNQQIGELYGPLVGLLTDLEVILRIKEVLLPGGKFRDVKDLDIARFFEEKYIFPLNREMSRLIISKRHLFDAEGLPQSFHDFLEYAAEYECLHELWKATGIESDKGYKGSVFPAKEQPKSFKGDVLDKLANLRSQQQQVIQKLHRKVRQESIHGMDGQL